MCLLQAGGDRAESPDRATALAVTPGLMFVTRAAVNGYFN